MLAEIERRRQLEPTRLSGGPLIRSALGTESSRSIGQPNAQPLGGLTGAPPQTEIRTAQVIPFASVGVNRQEASLIAQGVRANRVVVITAPLVGFSIFVGPSSTSPSRGMQLPAGIPYEYVLPGGQALYAVTDAPVYLPVQIQIAAILVGDEERKPE